LTSVKLIIIHSRGYTVEKYVYGNPLYISIEEQNILYKANIAKRSLNNLDSLHLARRCFAGILYKQVKDPNLVGSLSKHKVVSQ